MKKYLLSVLCASLFFSAITFANERTENNGNLILKNIPIIPESIKQDLTQYQNVRSAPFRGFNREGSQIFITTRFGNVSQLHRVKKQGGAREQITFFEEPIGSISRKPGSQLIAFTMDAGGTENNQIFILDPKKGSSVMLTDGKSRNGGPLWEKKGSRIAYQSTRRNGQSNDVWMMDSKNMNSAEMILESPDGTWWGPSDWSRDGKKILIQNYISITNAKAYLLDIESKKKEMILGSDETESYNAILSFDRSQKGVFFLTNEYGEFNQLAHKNLVTNKITVLTKDIPWDIGGFAISSDHKKAAFTINEGGMGSLYLLDTGSKKYRKVDHIPIGLLGGIEFSEDGTKLGLTVNSYQTPSDSYVLDLKNNPLLYGDLNRWTVSEIGGLDASEFVEPKLITYKSFDQKTIPAFIYAKECKDPQPVIISIHGGPEGQSRPSFSQRIQLWAQRLDAAVITPNVRGSEGYGKSYLGLDNGFLREDSVKDIGALLDWIEGQPCLDSTRVAVIGGSYGGYMVLASVTHYSDRLKAAVDIVGISNFVTFLENTEDYRRDLRRVEYGDERDPEMRAFLESISPNNNIEKINVPILVVQGENDPRVPVTESEQVVKSLEEKEKTVWYMNALNEGHGFRKKENRDIYEQTVILFFEKYL
ncbi:MAG: S9 family peptidase [Gammaproteobacteria bacterium]|jgi:dipeptidyl aminopeptidase/acylaminoacyl peptidase|nr:TetR family transcriptional regulator [Gammaproteobacteria bacterium]MBQ09629.1 TetR family transcriptional regulator [Gammaproteobacteria bacterium]MDP6146653.1 S9 family peptidase [Gammaproteobacteria bacterium]HJL80598.1 S9 family peptidase [Gammaproteobacteria bacterium]HJM09598.1 S9 family peptidase [Gammaproteobacteria bacterium]|tara:strand:+ start:46293 stop:48233 length:1941 start_codon:yes stop_codon:yes gene_type:complete